MGYIHFAFLGPESQWAAEASECAADQNAFWEYHDYVFELPLSQTTGGFTRDNLKAAAAELGLEETLFNECMDTEKYAQVVLNESRWAQSIGVQSTPTFVINGFVVLGAQPYEVFTNIFDQAQND